MSRGFIAVSAKLRRQKEQACGTISMVTVNHANFQPKSCTAQPMGKAQKAALADYICSQPVLVHCPSQHELSKT